MAAPRAKSFEQVIRLNMAAVKGDIQKRHAAIARAGLAAHLAGLEHKPTVVTFVDGRRDASEDSVKPFGVIRYEFRQMADIAVWALERCRELSPVKSGAYRESWFVMVGGKEVDPAAVAAVDEITITNDRPYHRKLEVTVNSQRLHGGKKTIRVPAGIVEAVRQEILRKYPGVSAEVAFMELAGGYVLRGHGSRRGRATVRRRSEDVGTEPKEAPKKRNRRGERERRRKDRQIGQPITYPALTIKVL